VDQGLYGQTELALVPETALDLARGCGNPTGFAQLKPGEVVVDFGCGGGIDVILAAHKVGPQGKVVGIDAAPHMSERARQAVAEVGLQDQDIELKVAELEDTHLPDDYTDIIISNCVINLCPDKEAVYQEAYRILRPGGRLAISDIVLTEAIDPALQERFCLTWSGCLGGAIPEADYWQTMKNTGFTEIQIISRHVLNPKELAAMSNCPGNDFTPSVAPEDLAQVEGKVASVKFTAQKK
jgi:arsenite methyltransferase